MEYSEAIKRFKPIVDNEAYTDSFQDACKLAIKAMELQVAKKLEYEADGYDENGNLVYDYARCPVCGHDFEYGINDWGCNYCCEVE